MQDLDGDSARKTTIPTPVSRKRESPGREVQGLPCPGSRGHSRASGPTSSKSRNCVSMRKKLRWDGSTSSQPYLSVLKHNSRLSMILGLQPARVLTSPGEIRHLSVRLCTGRSPKHPESYWANRASYASGGGNISW